MNEIFEKAINEKTEKAINTFIANFLELKPVIHERMEKYLRNGFFGFEFMRDPFLWREDCQTVIENINKEIESLGYSLFMNDKYHTVAILPSKEFESSLKSNCFVGFDRNKQYIHYTLDDRTEESISLWREDIKKYKESLDKKLESIEDKIK